MPGGHLIVIANEKGGVGKSTLATHIVVQLLGMGRKVAYLDMDRRQASTRIFFQNRLHHQWVVANPHELDFQPPGPAQGGTPAQAHRMLQDLVDQARGAYDHLVVDTPGQSGSLHNTLILNADILVTPINDSYVDLSALSRVDTAQARGDGALPYVTVVSRARKARTRPLDWCVVRNRLSPSEPRNRKRFDNDLKAFAEAARCRVLAGLRERVIFRELFPWGLTAADLGPGLRPVPVAMSHILARAEMARLMADMGFNDAFSA